jgi:hypothetical protein
MECWTGMAVNISNGKLTYILLNDRAKVFRLYKQ